MSDKKSLITKMSAQYYVEPEKFLETLRATAFADAKTNEELLALCIVADQYGLNPFTREIYAFIDKRRGGVIPIVGIDGWLRIINNHPQFNGMSFGEADEDQALEGARPAPKWMECTIHRKDREHPTTIRERLREVFRNTDPWRNNTYRMLRHKTIIQSARVAFGFAGIYEPDEGDRILSSGPELVTATVLNTELKQAQAADDGVSHETFEDHEDKMTQAMLDTINSADTTASLLNLPYKPSELPEVKRTLVRDAYLARKAELEGKEQTAREGGMDDEAT